MGDAHRGLQQALTRWLSQPETYPECPAHVDVLQTHLSWVFLTDQHAYKLKKPVHFEFVDFSTPEVRRRACEDELRLNRRMAHDVYLQVLPITKSASGTLQLGGAARAVRCCWWSVD